MHDAGAIGRLAALLAGGHRLMIQDHELSASELEAKMRLVAQGRIGPPPGIDPPNYRNRLSELLGSAIEPGERLLQLASAISGIIEQGRGHAQILQDHTVAIRAVGMSLSADGEAINRLRSRLQAVEARVIPQNPSERGIRWSNLWRAFTFVPGTARPRILLCLWEIGLWLPPSIAVFVGREWGGWVGAVGGFGIGALASFVLHELFFILYGEKIAKVPLLEEGEPSATTPSFNATLERWGGPTA